MAAAQSIPATLPVSVDTETLIHVFTTALEGGIGYWSCATEYHWSLPGTDFAYDFDGFYAVIEETECDEDTPPVHRIDAACILRGLLHFAQPGNGYTHVRQVARALLLGDDEVDYDAEVADCIVQAGLFGEVIYG